MRVIPVQPDEPRQALEFRVGSNAIKLSIWWQPSDRSWHASVESPVGAPVVTGRRIVLDSGLLASTPHSLPGDIYCRLHEHDIPNVEPLLGAWGVTHHLVWEEAT